MSRPIVFRSDDGEILVLGRGDTPPSRRDLDGVWASGLEVMPSPNDLWNSWSAVRRSEAGALEEEALEAASSSVAGTSSRL